MDKNIFKIILSLLILQLLKIDETKGNMRVKISCNVNSVNWIVIGNLKTCQNDHTHSVSEPSHSEFLEIEINREKGYFYRPTSIYEIKGLAIENLPMNSLPKGLKQKLPKLRAIDIKSCGLTSLNQDDMMPFGRDLISAAFWYNSLTSIDANVFEHNPNLKFIAFNGNPIKFIEPGFFENLAFMMSLQQVKFSDAGCIDQNFFSKIGHNIRNFDWNDRNCRFKTRPIPTPAVFEGDSYEEIEIVVEDKNREPLPEVETIKEVVKEINKENTENEKKEKVVIAVEETESDESVSEPENSKRKNNRKKDKEMKKLKKQLEKSDEKVKTLEEQKTSLENQNSMKKRENDALKINLEIAKEEKKVLEAKLKNVTNSLEDFKKIEAKKNAENENRMKDLEKIETLLKKLTESRKSSEELREKFDKLEEKVSNLEEKDKNSTKHLEKARSEIENLTILQSECAQKDLELVEMRENYTVFENECNENYEKLSKESEELSNELTANLTKVESDFNEKVEELESLKNKLAKANSSIVDLSNSETQHKTHIEKLENTIKINFRSAVKFNQLMKGIFHFRNKIESKITCSVDNSIHSCTIEADSEDSIIGEIIFLNEEPKEAVMRNVKIENVLMMFVPQNFGEKFPSLEKFRAKSAGLVRIRGKSFHGMSNLKVLELMENIIFEISANALETLVELEELDLSNNKLESIDLDTFKSLEKLQKLNLQGNIIKNVDKNFVTILKQIKSIQHINLAENACINSEYPISSTDELEKEIANNCSVTNQGEQTAIKLAIDCENTACPKISLNWTN